MSSLQLLGSAKSLPGSVVTKTDKAWVGGLVLMILIIVLSKLLLGCGGTGDVFALTSVELEASGSVVLAEGEEYSAGICVVVTVRTPIGYVETKPCVVMVDGIECLYTFESLIDSSGATLMEWQGVVTGSSEECATKLGKFKPNKASEVTSQ